MRAPFPANESERLAKLLTYDILDTPPEAAYNDLVRIAASICDMPIALVSLVDADRQWFKAHIGLEATDTHRDLAFCAHSILQAEVLVVPDATQDPRFADNPFVTGKPHIRFYAGTPLISPDGLALGTLCVIDTRPRELASSQVEALAALGRQVVSLLELRLKHRHLQQEIAERQVLQQQLQQRSLAMETASDGIAILSDRQHFSYINRAYIEMLGYREASDLIGIPWQQLYDAGAIFHLERVAFPQMIATGRWRGESVAQRQDGQPLFQELTLTLTDVGVICISRDIGDRLKTEAALWESEMRWQFALEGAGDGVWDWQIPANQAYFSPRWKAMLGYGATDIGDTIEEWKQRLHPEDVSSALETLNAHFKGETSVYEQEHRLRRADGTYQWVLTRGKVMEWGEHSQPQRIIGTQTDITRHKLLEEALQSSEQRFRSVLETMPLLGVMLDLQGRIHLINDALLKLTHWQRDEVLYTQWFERFVAPEERSALYQQFLARTQPPEQWQAYHETMLLTRLSERRLVAWRNTALRDAQGRITGFASIGEDITDRRQAELDHQKLTDRLLHSTRHDPLTGIPNRAYFLETLAQRFVQGQRRQDAGFFAVLFLDLNRFKAINDTLGHGAGDILLRTVAHRLQTCIRSTDLAARLSGDEFVILLTSIYDIADAITVVHHIHQTLSLPISLGQQDIVISSSIGIAQGPGHFSGPEAILQAADTAMYQAKHHHQKYVVFEEKS